MSKLEQITLAVVRAAIFATPLAALVCGNELFFPDALFTNVIWKNVVFRILVEVATCLWVVLAWRVPRYRPRRSPILIAYAAFIVAIAVADLAGVRPATSFWGNYERMEGLVGHLHLFAFFVVASAVLDRVQLWRWFFLVTFAACLLVSADGVLQLVRALLKAQGLYEGRPFLQPVPLSAQADAYLRVDARIASPVFLAMYLLFHAFFAAWLAGTTQRRAARIGYVAAAALFIAVLYTTGTRVAYVGLLVGVALTLLSLGWFGENPRHRTIARRALAVIAVLVLAVSVVVWLKPSALGQIPLLKRLFGLQVGGALEVRLELWGIAAQGFLERPLLGWGQENFSYVFNKYFDPRLYSRELPMWWDQPHNAYWGWLIAAGIPGLLAYLALFGTGLWCLWRRASFPLLERSLWIGALAAYATFVAIQPDHLTSHMLFFAVLAYVHAAVVRDRPVAERAPARLASGIAALALALLASAFLIRCVNVAAFRPAIAIADAQRAAVVRDALGQKRPDAPAAIAAFRRALTAGPIGLSQIRDQVVAIGEQLIDAPAVSAAHKEEIARLAVDEMRKEVAENPDNVHDLVWLGRFLVRIGNAPAALPFLERALAIAPQRQLVAFETAGAYIAAGRKADAVAILRRIYARAPELKEVQINTAILAIRAGDAELENEVLDAIRARTKTDVLRIDQRIIDAMMQEERYADVVARLESVVGEWIERAKRGVPLRDQVRARVRTLAFAYFGAGQQDRAVALLDTVIALDPSQAGYWRYLRGEMQKK
jgi:O-antigen ligase